MNIQTKSPNSFQGYDARPLRGFIMNSNAYGIASEMHKIGKKEGFKIFSANHSVCSESVPYENTSVIKLWAQDYWTIIKDKLLFLENTLKTRAIKSFFNLKNDITQYSTRKALEERVQKFNTLGIPSLEFMDKSEKLIQALHNTHIPGGNIFIVKNKDSETAIVGQNEAMKYTEEDIQYMYNVKDVIFLPQMDFHLDLFIRPLDERKILIADDRLTLDILNESLAKFHDYISDLPEKEKDRAYKAYVKMFNYSANFAEMLEDDFKIDEIEEILEDRGFDVIRVPGRLYEEGDYGLKHSCNFMNANALKNKDGDLVYITNKTNINKKFGLKKSIADKIGFNLEKSFIDSISPYVNPEHIYFVKGQENFIPDTMLPEYQGGIHCACSEVPEHLL